MTDPSHVALGGALERHPEGWRWADGAPEARVRDLTPTDHYRFPVLLVDSEEVVEVPVGMVHEDDCLASLLGSREGVPLRKRAQSYLVPKQEWDRLTTGAVMGVTWDPEHKPDILERAEPFWEV